MKLSIRTVLLSLLPLATTAALADDAIPKINAPTPGQVYPISGGEVTYNVDSEAARKANPSAGCCELELQYKNASGAWTGIEPQVVEYSKMVFGDYLRSASEYSAGTEWRMRARIFQFKKEFPWTDWVEFKVQ